MRTSVLCIALLFAFCQSLAAAELTINPPPGPVGPIATLTGKAPAEKSNVFLIVNPMDTPYQFWVQKGPASVDPRRNWYCSVHFGDPGPAHSGKQFVVVAVAEPATPLHEGQVLTDWPTGRWITKPVVFTRK